jgi:hypothetical protein
MEEKNLMQPKKKIRWSLASLIFGILIILALLLPNSIATSIPLFAGLKKFLLNEGPLLAIIFGALGFKEKKSFAIFGIVIGIIFILLWLILFLAVMAGIK